MGHMDIIFQINRVIMMLVTEVWLDSAVANSEKIATLRYSFPQMFLSLMPKSLHHSLFKKRTVRRNTHFYLCDSKKQSDIKLAEQKQHSVLGLYSFNNNGVSCSWIAFWLRNCEHNVAPPKKMKVKYKPN